MTERPQREQNAIENAEVRSTVADSRGLAIGLLKVANYVVPPIAWPILAIGVTLIALDVWDESFKAWAMRDSLISEIIAAVLAVAFTALVIEERARRREKARWYPLRDEILRNMCDAVLRAADETDREEAWRTFHNEWRINRPYLVFAATDKRVVKIFAECDRLSPEPSEDFDNAINLAKGFCEVSRRRDEERETTRQAGLVARTIALTKRGAPRQTD